MQDKIIGIYKITSPSNKIYIGQSRNIKSRFKDYKSSKTLTHEQPKLNNSFLKYGINNHIFEIVEECNLEELNTRERYWQDYYGVIKEGLNCVLTSTDKLPATVSDETRQKMSFSRKKYKQSKESIIKGSKKRSIPILQYDLEGNFIKEWPSAKIAGASLGIGNCNIRESIRGVIGSAGEYQWRNYEEGYPNKINPFSNLSFKTTYAFDLHGKYIDKYSTRVEAARKLLINQQDVDRSIKYNKPYKGYWFSSTRNIVLNFDYTDVRKYKLRQESYHIYNQRKFMNKEINILREKLSALKRGPVLWIMSDVLTAVKEALFDSTGLKIKFDGVEIDNETFLSSLITSYEQQLHNLLKQENTSEVRQIDLEDSIAEIKEKQEEV